jgi:hypothetical protein
MTSKGILLASLAGVCALALGQAVTAKMRLEVNGKPVPGQTLVSGGQVYIPLSALKAAGATTSVKSGTLRIGLGAAGGANQVGALEGKVGDWLFNGIWRFRVVSVGPNDDGRPGWKVRVELRNGTTLDNVALGGTGLDSITLVMADGNPIKPYNITDIDRPLGQGAGADVALVFYDDDGAGRVPDKLIVRIAPDAATKAFLKGQGASYSVADPSFRVSLR